MNWYLVRDGKVVTRYGDQLPMSFIDPATGAEIDVSGKSREELAAMGVLAGEATDPLAYDAASQKSYIDPQVPDTLQQYQDGWQMAIKARTPLAVPVVTEQWVVEPLTDAELNQMRDAKLRDLRSTRDMELLRTDHYMLLDSPVADDPKTLQAWKDYRQALRDLPDQVDDETAIKWPAAPDDSGPVSAVIATGILSG